MELKDQVVSLELAKKMKELGFEQDISQFVWVADSNTKKYKIIGNSAGEFCRWRTNFIACGGDDKDYGWYSAYTVAELGEMLKRHKNYMPKYYDYKWRCAIKDVSFSEDTEADVRAKMLIYLKENNLLKEEHHG